MTDKEITSLGLRIGMMIIAGLLVIGSAMEWSLKGLSQAGYLSLACWVFLFFNLLYRLLKDSKQP